MALPSSGEISLNSLKSEFSDTGDSALEEFYRGAGLVPATEQQTTFFYIYGAWSPSYYQPFGGAEFLSYASTADWKWFGNIAGFCPAYSGAKCVYGGYEYQAGAAGGGGGYYIRRRTRTLSSSTEDVPINTNVPENGEISLEDFYNAKEV